MTERIVPEFLLFPLTDTRPRETKLNFNRICFSFQRCRTKIIRKINSEKRGRFFCRKRTTSISIEFLASCLDRRLNERFLFFFSTSQKKNFSTKILNSSEIYKIRFAFLSVVCTRRDKIVRVENSCSSWTFIFKSMSNRVEIERKLREFVFFSHLIVWKQEKLKNSTIQRYRSARILFFSKLTRINRWLISI